MAYVQQATTITQVSTGWCSPNIANVSGSVTIHCQGVDPKAMEKLNAHLRQVQSTFHHAQVDLKNALLEAERFRKSYLELEGVLASFHGNSQLAKEATGFLHQGKLEEVAATLNRMFLVSGAGGHADPQFALERYSLGLAYQLQFLAAKALPCFKDAYRASPSEWKFAQAYAEALLDVKDYVEAQPVLLAMLKIARSDAATHPEELAVTLNSLALLYSATGQTGEAEVQFREALNLDRTSNPNRPGEAEVLNNLAVLYMKERRSSDAEKTFEEALIVFRQLARSQPDLYEPYVAETLSNLATLYSDGGQMQKAEGYFKESIPLIRKLASANPEVYNGNLAEALSNLAAFRRRSGQIHEAEDAFAEAQSILEKLAFRDPNTYQPSLSQLLSSEIAFYTEVKQYSKAETIGQKALASINNLKQINPAVYDPLLAITLAYMAVLYGHTGRSNEAEDTYGKALTILRPFAAENLTYRLELARLLNNQATLYQSIQRPSEAEASYKEALDSYNLLAQTNHSGFEFERANTLYNLGELDQAISDLKHAEEPYQKALEIYRQLAKDDPSIYLPYVSHALGGLALLHFKLGHVAQAETEIESVIQINRDRVQGSHVVGAADDLAKSLFLASLFSQNIGQKCQFLSEAASVAVDVTIKESCQQAMSTCPRSP